MVLWEITLATAYFLGLKRTYRLASKAQHRIIGRKHPRVRRFVHERTRSIFDVALRVHRNIQGRDIQVGRDFGNKILRWLDHIKPSAQIIGHPPRETPSGSSSNSSISKRRSSYFGSGRSKRRFSYFGSGRSTQKPKSSESEKHMFAASKLTCPRRLPNISMKYPQSSAGPIMQSRQNSDSVLITNRPRGMPEGVIRKDIMEWLQRK